jgi:hypothetical protein
MKCLLDRRDRAALAVAEGLGWPASECGDIPGNVLEPAPERPYMVELDLPSTWAADVAAVMGVFAEGVRRAAEAQGK